MKKIAFAFATAIAAGSLLVSATASAGDNYGAASNNYYATFRTGDTIVNAKQDLNDNLAMFGLAAGLRLYPEDDLAVRLELEYDRYTQFTDMTKYDHRVTADLNEILLNVYLEKFFTKSFAGYVFGGVGSGFGRVNEYYQGTNIFADSEGSLAGKVGLGMEYFFNDSVSLDVAARYGTIAEIDDVNFHSCDIYAGINWNF